MLSDCLDFLAEQSTANLLKPLRVIFEGEPAIDEGGVRKELFQLTLTLTLTLTVTLTLTLTLTPTLTCARSSSSYSLRSSSSRSAA